VDIITASGFFEVLWVKESNDCAWDSRSKSLAPECPESLHFSHFQV